MFKPHAFIILFGRRIASFTVFGIIGFVASLCITFFLIVFLQLSIYVWLFQILVALTAFFTLAGLMNFIKGKPVLVYYHHEIAIIFLTAVCILFIDRKDLLKYLDITVIGLGIFLVFGRIGCFMAGCCHGKPTCFGVHYNEEHLGLGFPYYYLGAKLFPVQLIESIGVSLIVTFLIFLVIFHQPPGEALTLYVLFYGLLRFFLEFARGDQSRPYYGRFSEAQWFSLALSVIILILSFKGWLLNFKWHELIIILWLTILSGIFIFERKTAIPWLKIKHYQIKKLAILITHLNLPEDNKNTTLNVDANTILITGGIIKQNNITMKYFTVSMYPLTQSLWIESVGRIIYMLNGCSGDFTILKKDHSIMQFVIKEQQFQYEK